MEPSGEFRRSTEGQGTVKTYEMYNKRDLSVWAAFIVSMVYDDDMRYGDIELHSDSSTKSLTEIALSKRGITKLVYCSLPNSCRICRLLTR